MRRLIILVTASVLLTGSSGCLVNMWSGDNIMRSNELLNVSENLRQASLEWERFWLIDQPSHLTPQRIHGGIE